MTTFKEYWKKLKSTPDSKKFSEFSFWLEIQKAKKIMIIRISQNILAKSLSIEMDLWLMMVLLEIILTHKTKNSWMNSIKSILSFWEKKIHNNFSKSHVPEELRAKYPKGLKVGIMDRTYRLLNILLIQILIIEKKNMNYHPHQNMLHFLVQAQI